MNKLLLLLFAAAALVGCSHNPTPGVQPENRQPSQAVDYNYVLQFKGRVGISVSKNSAGYDGDAFFTVQVDCNGDRKLSREEQGRIVKIDAKSVSEKQRRVFASFKKRSERQTKDANAKPYLKVNVMTANTADPCAGTGIGQVLVGYNPTFSSAAKR